MQGYYASRISKTARKARIVLIAILAIFVIMDVWVYLATWPELRGKLALQMGLNTMWTTFFLAAIWFGQNWARYVLGFFLMLSVIFGVAVYIPQLVEAKIPVPWILPIMLVFHLIALLVIAFHPDIRKMVHSR